jgi:hypothetical protein
MASFFNTTQELPSVARQGEHQAIKQEDFLLNILKVYAPKAFTAFELLPHFPHHTPVTSIRRALTCLYQNGEIKRIGKRKEVFGRNNYTYSI